MVMPRPQIPPELLNPAMMAAPPAPVGGIPAPGAMPGMAPVPPVGWDGPSEDPVLREAQLVRVEKRGQQRIYHLNPVGLAELRSYAESLWDDVLQAFGEEAERIAAAALETEGKSGEMKIRRRAK